MSTADSLTALLSVNDVSHYYGETQALNHVSFSLPTGSSVGLIGPDGVGKSTLLSLISGIKILQSGQIRVLQYDVDNKNDRQKLFHHIAFMPQGLGKNLYPSLSVYENIDFIASLFGLRENEKKDKIHQLLSATDLLPFKDRPAGKLSGGMKQKLSLCSALVHNPQLLILDEPTTGVDPLSRRQFWALIDKLQKQTPNMTVLVSTAYTEEAAQFDQIIAMDNGQILIQDKTQHILDKTHSQNLEAAYNALLPEDKKSHISINIPTFIPEPNEPYVIEATHLTKKFGDFTAVNDVSFQINKGEIFGFLGSNGCGKSTTMKMLTGLLSPSSGQAALLGQSIDATDIATRMKVGYMSQSFSLYEELSVEQNLQLHAKLYHLPEKDIPNILDNALKQFDLTKVRDAQPQSIPLGIRQRLQLAAACLHQPEVLILDEPTSGVDPQARDMFWAYLGKLSREEKVTIFVSTHFMNEAMLCDRISLMHKGRVLAVDTPTHLSHQFGHTQLEDVFVHYLEEAETAAHQTTPPVIQNQSTQTPLTHLKFDILLPKQLLTIVSFAKREALELMRDKIRMGFAILGSLIYLVTAAYCVTFDIENITFAVLDQDQSRESRSLINEFSGSRYFSEHKHLKQLSDIKTELKAHRSQFILHIPPEYGKELLAKQQPELAFYIDGTASFSASNIKSYIKGVLFSYASSQMTQNKAPNEILEPRFIYNPEFKSIYAITPGILMMALILIPTMLSTLSVVREKELGSIINLYTSPASVLEYLIGKQLPYVLLSLMNALVLLFVAVWVFGVPIKGSFLSLILGVILYVYATTALGLLISSFLASQLAAMFASAITTIIVSINFSGLLYPTSTLEGGAYLMGISFPSSWFQLISLGIITKGLSVINLWPMYLILIGFIVLYMSSAAYSLKKQEK